MAILQAAQEDSITGGIPRLESELKELKLELKETKESKLELKGEMRDLRRETTFWVIFVFWVGFWMVCYA